MHIVSMPVQHPELGGQLTSETRMVQSSRPIILINATRAKTRIATTRMDSAVNTAVTTRAWFPLATETPRRAKALLSSTASMVEA